jgi:hypothetical protein
VAFTESTRMRPSDARRRSRLRAVLLVAVWVLPAVWCAAHAVGHELESGHHEAHVVVSASVSLPSVSCNHDHAHSHPEASAVLSTEEAKKLDATMLLTAAFEIKASEASLHSHGDAALGYAARRAAAVSEPRAPPIS